MNVKFDKKVKSVIAVYAIIALVFILLFAFIPFKKTASGWIAFAFSIVALAASLFVCYCAFGKESKELKSKIYGYPIFRVGVLYAVVQIAVCVLVCVLSCFFTVPYWVTLLVCVILLAAAAIGVIATDNTRDIIEELEETGKVETEKLALFNIDIAGIADSCGDPAVKKELEKLAEAFRFSDPVSSDATAPIEEELRGKLATLKLLISEGESEKITGMISEIKNTLSERNRICKANKTK